MTYKDFELAVLHMKGVEAVKVILTGDMQRKVKVSARRRKWRTATMIPNDTFLVDLGEYTLAVSLHSVKRLLD